MSVHVQEHHLKKARAFVQRTHANGGLAPVDLDRFWKDQEQAKSDIWADPCPQLPLGIGMSSECMFTELGMDVDWELIRDRGDRLLEITKRYNDKAEEIVGKRLLREEPPSDPSLRWPATKQLHDIFEAENEWHGQSYWLHQSANNEDELAALLDRVEARLEDLREFMLPANWESEKERLVDLGCSCPSYRGQRGPVTFAMSIYGVENLIFLLVDDPDLAKRFSDLILKAILGRARVLDEEAGLTPDNWQHGWYWCDDNCCNLNADMYRAFAYPIMKGVFETYSPEPDDLRGQHSDSDMAHHLPAFAELGLNSTNFGPNLTVSEIRKHLPHAEIHGQLAPFTFSRNEEVHIVAECLRDFEMSREKKGVVFATAGSINHGSRLSGMRLIMAAIQEYCRY